MTVSIPRRTMLGSLVAMASLAGCARGGFAHGARPRPMSLDALELVADGIERPESVTLARDGRAYVSSSAAAVIEIGPGGARRPIGVAPAANGIALDRQGRMIIANFGLLKNLPGTLQRLDLESGAIETIAAEIDGRPLVASNGPAIGEDGSVYCTHSTWSDPTNIGTTNPAGFVYRVDPSGRVEMVHRGIRGANGCCFDADFSHLYVAQTAAGNIVRLSRRRDGGYGDPAIWGPRLGEAPDNLQASTIVAMPPAERVRLGHPDGIAFDAAGNLWATIPFANRIVAITPRGQVIDVIVDAGSTKIQMPTGLAFGGADLRELYIASMRNGKLWKLKVETPGLALPHWRA
ncbi:MAG: SMP-30/gluconolactonase/LRE family protein [Sphingobium sp.]